jgi:hypothetical protein
MTSPSRLSTRHFSPDTFGREASSTPSSQQSTAELASKPPTNYIVGSWVCFFEVLRAGRYSADLTASTLKRGRKRVITSDKELSTSNNDAPTCSSADDDDDVSDARSKRRDKVKERKRKRYEQKRSGGTRSGLKGGAASY